MAQFLLFWGGILWGCYLILDLAFAAPERERLKKLQEENQALQQRNNELVDALLEKEDL